MFGNHDSLRVPHGSKHVLVASAWSNTHRWHNHASYTECPHLSFLNEILISSFFPASVRKLIQLKTKIRTFSKGFGTDAGKVYEEFNGNNVSIARMFYWFEFSGAAHVGLCKACFLCKKGATIHPTSSIEEYHGFNSSILEVCATYSPICPAVIYTNLILHPTALSSRNSSLLGYIYSYIDVNKGLKSGLLQQHIRLKTTYMTALICQLLLQFLLLIAVVL